MQKNYIVRLTEEDGEQEARIIATRLGSSPPAGYANWSLRLLVNQVVELSVSHETVRKLLKKRHDSFTDNFKSQARSP
jgi:hypothetical protein